MILRSGRIIGRADVAAGHPTGVPNPSSPKVDEGTARIDEILSNVARSAPSARSKTRSASLAARSTSRCAPPARSAPITALHRRSFVATSPSANPTLRRACRRLRHPPRPTRCSAHRYRLTRRHHHPPQTGPTSAKNSFDRSSDRSGQSRKSATTAAAAIAPTASAIFTGTTPTADVTNFESDTVSAPGPEPDPDPDPKPSRGTGPLYVQLAWPPFALLPYRHPESGFATLCSLA